MVGIIDVERGTVTEDQKGFVRRSQGATLLCLWIGHKYCRLPLPEVVSRGDAIIDLEDTQRRFSWFDPDRVGIARSPSAGSPSAEKRE